MNRVILASSVIVGIAIMLSMSTMPANADRLDNVCVDSPTSGNIDCTKAVETGQHVMIILRNGATAGCHYNVSEAGNVLWILTLDHGPSKCPNDAAMNKVNVTVRGS